MACRRRQKRCAPDFFFLRGCSKGITVYNPLTYFVSMHCLVLKMTIYLRKETISENVSCTQRTKIKKLDSLKKP